MQTRLRRGLLILLAALLLALPAHAEEDYLPREGPFTYVNAEYEISFEVPDGWEQVFDDSLVENEALFFSTDEQYRYLYLYVVDYWAGYLTEEEQDYIDPAMLDSSAFTTGEMEYLFDFEAGSISTVTYGANPYFFTVETWSDEAENDGYVVAELSVHPVSETTVENTYVSTHLIAVHNGYFYWFEFDGTPEDAQFATVEQLLATVSFPTSAVPDQPPEALTENEQAPITPEQTEPPVNEETADEQESSVLDDILGVLEYLFAVLLTLAVVLFVFCRLPALLYRRSLRKRPRSDKAICRFIFFHTVIAMLVWMSGKDWIYLLLTPLIGFWNYRTLTRANAAPAACEEKRFLNGHDKHGHTTAHHGRAYRKEGRRLLNGKTVQLDEEARAAYRRLGPELDGRDDCFYDERTRDDYRCRGPEID